MSKLLRAVSFANGEDCPHAGQFLLSADFEAHDGRGFMAFTPDRGKALRFKTVAEAMAFCMTSPKCRPIRQDGRPNRPLTALTIELVESPDEPILEGRWVERTSQFSGKTRKIMLMAPPGEWADYDSGKMLIQNALRSLTDDEREFIMTGTTPEEWKKAFPPEEEADKDEAASR